MACVRNVWLSIGVVVDRGTFPAIPDRLDPAAVTERG